MTPIEYFDQIVEPTLNEYFREPTDLRRALLSCIVIVRIHDYIKYSNPAIETETAKYFEMSSKALPDLMYVHDVAVATKHVYRKKNGFIIDRVKSRPAAVFDDAAFDVSRWDDEIGGIEAQLDTGSIALDKALNNSFEYFKRLLRSNTSIQGLTP